MTNSILILHILKGLDLKIKAVILSFVLLFALTLPILAQNLPKEIKKAEMSRRDMKRMMGKTTFESTAQGLHYKVWLFTQEGYDQLMNSRMGQMMMGNFTEDSVVNNEMDEAAMVALMAGTHHLMIHITDADKRQEVDHLIVKAEFTAPSKKVATVELHTTIMNYFGSGLAFDEKGDYQITINVQDENVFKTTHFEYTVK